MTSYINFSVAENSKLPVIASESMKTISKLDAISDIALSKLENETTRNLKVKKSTRNIEKKIMLKSILDNVADRKVNLAMKTYDVIDHTIKCVDDELRLLEKAMRLNGHSIPNPPDVGYESAKRRKRNDEILAVEPIYCSCREIAYGDMICCENEACDVEWFHYGCVGLIKVPKGKWYCKPCKVILGLTKKRGPY